MRDEKIYRITLAMPRWDKASPFMRDAMIKAAAEISREKRDALVLGSEWMNDKAELEDVRDALMRGCSIYAYVGPDYGDGGENAALMRLVRIPDTARDGLLALAEGSLLGMEMEEHDIIDDTVIDRQCEVRHAVIKAVETLGPDGVFINRFYLQADYL